jgi:Zn-dependent protease with chaperone function
MNILTPNVVLLLTTGLISTAVVSAIYLVLQSIGISAADRFKYLKYSILTLPMIFFAILLIPNTSHSATAVASTSVIADTITLAKKTVQFISPTTTISWNLIGYIYLGIVSFLLLRLGRSWLFLRDLVIGCTPVDHFQGYPIFTQNKGLPPANFGFVSPAIVVPVELINTISKEEYRLVLQHELIHIQRNDYLHLISLKTMSAFLFFSPFMLLLSEYFEREMEMSCDDEVIEKSSQYSTKKEYGTLLLKLASGSKAPNSLLASGLFISLTSLRRRIEYMKVSKSIKFRGLALIALAVSTMVSASLVQALEVTEEISSAFEAGNEVTTSVNLTIERRNGRITEQEVEVILALGSNFELRDKETLFTFTPYEKDGELAFTIEIKSSFNHEVMDYLVGYGNSFDVVQDYQNGPVRSINMTILVED